MSMAYSPSKIPLSAWWQYHTDFSKIIWLRSSLLTPDILFVVFRLVIPTYEENKKQNWNQERVQSAPLRRGNKGGGIGYSQNQQDNTAQSLVK